jgi:hypothetical protein
VDQQEKTPLHMVIVISGPTGKDTTSYGDSDHSSLTTCAMHETEDVRLCKGNVTIKITLFLCHFHSPPCPQCFTIKHYQKTGEKQQNYRQNFSVGNLYQRK